MNKAEILIVADFDGTVASRDVGYNFFRHFSGGKNNELLPFWKSGEMTTRECLQREAELVTVDYKEVFPFLDKFELDPGFGELVDLCESQGIPFSIASDGLDFYINYLLKRFDFDHIPRVSNKGVFEGNRLRIEFPYDNRECRSCGSCKAERIEDLKKAHGNGAKVVFIGDGHSDACATRAADIVFAKKDLKVFCENRQLKYHDFENFYDVVKKLTMIGFLS
ncbi:MAG: MtnX-like HAD-IB family phosphatase [Candidatus Zixiibacteriota bacterium]